MKLNGQSLIPPSPQSSLLFTSIQNQSFTLIPQPLREGFVAVFIFWQLSLEGDSGSGLSSSDAKRSSSVQGWSKRWILCSPAPATTSPAAPRYLVSRQHLTAGQEEIAVLGPVL